jgi:hypothetical protein
MAILNQGCRIVALGLALALGSQAAPSGSGPMLDEYEMKALFLYNFAKFVEWSDRPFESPTQAITICVAGQDPFGHWLRDTVKGRLIDGRPLIVAHISNIAEAGFCRMLFIASSEENRLPALLAGVSAKGILTIADSDRATEQGVMINFILEGGKVHFEINPGAAESEKLRISSKLLSLARIVKK